MMQEYWFLAIVAWTAAGGFFYGVASIVRAVYDGRSKLVRAKRGDPELPDRRPPLLGFVFRRRDDVP